MAVSVAVQPSTGRKARIHAHGGAGLSVPALRHFQQSVFVSFGPCFAGRTFDNAESFLRQDLPSTKISKPSVEAFFLIPACVRPSILDISATDSLPAFSVKNQTSSPVHFLW
jgi:hypothetical protein